MVKDQAGVFLDSTNPGASITSEGDLKIQADLYSPQDKEDFLKVQCKNPLDDTTDSQVLSNEISLTIKKSL